MKFISNIMLTAVAVIPGMGYVTFKETTDRTVEINVQLSGLSHGLHGFHIHEYGDLRDGCESTCAHYNPHHKQHGGPLDRERHLGDLGNIVASSDGKVDMIFQEHLISLRGKYSIIGRSVVVHANQDDLGKGPFEDSQTTGHAGKRIGCGVIGYSKT